MDNKPKTEIGESLNTFGDYPLFTFPGNDYLCSVNIKLLLRMKKYMLFLALSVVMLSSCGTYTGQGAYAGATFGSILGSAIGGISGGWQGSNVGQVVGMTGGAAVGAAIGAAADQKEAERYEAYQRQREQRRKQKSYGDDIYFGENDNTAGRVKGNNNSNRVNVDNGSGFDPSNSGDDRIDFDGAGPQKQQLNTTQVKTVKITSASTSTSSSKKLPFSYQPLQQ